MHSKTLGYLEVSRHPHAAACLLLLLGDESRFVTRWRRWNVDALSCLEPRLFGRLVWLLQWLSCISVNSWESCTYFWGIL